MVAMNFDCPICKAHTAFYFKKPNLIQPAFMTVTCEKCESRFEVKAKVKRGTDGKEGTYDAKCVVLGSLAKEIQFKQRALAT